MPKDLRSPYKPCFQHYANLLALPLWELIALSINLDPEELGKHGRPGSPNYPSYPSSIYLYQGFAKQRRIVLSIANSTNDIPFTNPNDTAPIDERYVKCEGFHQWAVNHNVELAEGFPWEPMQTFAVEVNTVPTDDLASLFDPVRIEVLEKMFPSGRWASWAERASRNGLIYARIGRGVYNPHKAAMWFITKGVDGWDIARCNRVLGNNLPTRSLGNGNLFGVAER